jgi:ubiquinone/menaquinone biosynthesis C-methylase UbiE
MHFSNPARNIEQFGLRSGDRVADLGTGTGHHSFEISKAVGPTGRVYAVDIQKDLLKKLVSQARFTGCTNIIPIVADIEKGTGLKDASVDAVLIANVLFQADDMFAFLKESLRILKPEGTSLIIDWSRSLPGGAIAHTRHIIAEDHLRETAEEVGFVFSSTIDAGKYHYGIIFRKPK